MGVPAGNERGSVGTDRRPEADQAGPGSIGCGWAPVTVWCCSRGVLKSLATA